MARDIMAKSQNGYPVLSDSSECEKWVLPLGKGSYRHVILRGGHVGFVLACFIVWFHRKIERVNNGVWDEWGWAYRPVRGQEKGFSNHASGTAVDINATQHPLGVRNTFYPNQFRKIRRRLKGFFFQSVIFWGGDYVYRADEMHFEVNKSLPYVIKAAGRLRFTKIGMQVAHANRSHYRTLKWLERRKQREARTAREREAFRSE